MNLYKIDYENSYLLVAALTARNATNIIRVKTDDDHPLHCVDLCECELEHISEDYDSKKECVVIDTPYDLTNINFGEVLENGSE